MIPPPESNYQSVRNSNIELYRIVVMLLIVMHHYVVNSGLLNVMVNDSLSARSIFLYLFGMWGKTGINCFVLITGYFMCKSTITIRKFLKLLLEVEFYYIIIGLWFIIGGYTNFSWGKMIYMISPIKNIGSDFVSCFLLFYLFIPFLNILISNLSRRQHLVLVILSTSIYSVLGSVPWLGIQFNYISWFCILYFISSYIRIHRFYKNDSLSFWGVCTLGFILISIASVLFMIYRVQGQATSLTLPYFFVSDSNKILALTTSVSSFMFFKNIRIEYNSFINTVAASTFGVLLIHANSDEMRHWLWKDLCSNATMFYSDRIYIHAMLIPVSVFFTCILIDYLRKQTIEAPILNIVMGFIEGKKLFIL